MSRQPSYLLPNGKCAPVRPFRMLLKKLLPKNVRQVHNLSWEPTFKLISMAPGVRFNMNPQEIYTIAYDYLKSRIEYPFMTLKMKPTTWEVSYWSMNVQRSSIMKWGTERDKALLPIAISKKNNCRNQHVKILSDGRAVKRRRIIDPTKCRKVQRRIRNKETVTILDDDVDEYVPIPLPTSPIPSSMHATPA